MTSREQTKLRTGRVWARSILALGIVTSLAANVAAAPPTIIGQIVAAWSPVALLLTIELIVRVPIARRSWLSRARVGAAGMLAAIAAWTSYWHMATLAAANGEGAIAAHLVPLSVDGLVIVSAVSLAEIANRLTPPKPAAKPETPPTPPRPVPTIGTPDVPTRDLVRRIQTEHPEWTQQQVAAAAGCSERTVRRHAAA